jgi:competence protein ComEC
LPAPEVRYGARVRFPAELRRPLSARNPRGYDEAARARTVGFDLLARAPGFRIEAVGPLRRDPARVALAEIRSALLGEAGRWFSGRARATFGALVLGERRRAVAEDVAALRDAGLLHILAISGMHVVLVAGMISGVLRLLPLALRARETALAASLMVYGFLAGFGPPVARAIFVAELVLLGRFVDRRAPAMRHLALAAVVLLAVRPYDLADAGFQLSFAATAGLILGSRPLRGMRGPAMRYLGSPLLLTTAAQAFVLPVLIRQFGCVPVLAPVSNLAAAPVAAAIVPAGLVVLACALACPAILPAATASFWVLERGLYLAADIANRVAGPPFVAPPMPTAVGVAHVAALCLLLCAPRRRHRAAGAAATALTTAAILVGIPRGDGDLLARVTILDVSQGDACVVEVPGWGAVLVDAGDAERGFDAGASRVVPFLRQHGIGRLRGLVVTHPHRDHYGGAPSVLKAIRSDSLWVTCASGPLEEGYATLLEGATKAGLGIRGVSRGDLLPAAGAPGAKARLRIMHPPAGHRSLSANDMSVVLAVEAGGYSLMLTGDAEVAAESLMVSAGAVGRTDVLKVGHHGSRTATSRTFLDHTRPVLAVVPVGRGNKFGLPSRTTMDALAEAGCVIHRTDDSGAAIVELRRSGAWWRPVGTGWIPIR